MKNNMKATVFTTVLSTLLLAACLHGDEIRVDSQEEAAALLVAPTMVVSWDQVAAAMKPNFALTGDQAVQQVVPTTARIQDEVLHAFGASLGIGFKQTFNSSTSTNTATSTTNAATTAAGTTNTSADGSGSTSTATATTQPGVAPTAPTAAPAGGQLPQGSGVGGDLGLDPVTKYQSALALYEAVQMLNREAQYAAVMSDTVPYLVRIKFAVMPYRQHLPYSIHSRVSFFADQQCDIQQRQNNGDAPIKPYGMVGPPERAPADQKATCYPKDVSRTPQVIPLLAADDVERALKSNAVETASQIGVALSAMVNGTGASLSGNNLNQALHAIAGQDLNSRLTVSRTSGNTLYVRIGANGEGTSSAALAGQTYDIAVLLLVPRNYFTLSTEATPPDPQIRIVTDTDFRDVDDGHFLKDRSNTVLAARIDREMRRILVGKGLRNELSVWNKLDDEHKADVARQLAKPIQRGDAGLFTEVLSKPLTQMDDGTLFSLAAISDSQNANQNLWSAVSGILADTAIKSTFIELHLPKPLKIPHQTVVMADDGKESAQATFWGVKGSSATTLAPTWTFVLKSKDGEASPGPVTLPAQSVKFDPLAHVLTVAFQSPSKLGFADIDTSDHKNVVTLAEACDTDTPLLCPKLDVPSDDIAGFHVIVAKAVTQSEASANFGFVSGVSQVVADKAGNGSVSVVLKKLAAGDSVSLVLDGADIGGISDGSASSPTLADGAVLVSKNSTITYQLKNLHTGATVTVAAEGKGPTAKGKVSLRFGVISN